MAPFFDYLCKKCETITEEFHGINAKPPKCKECNGKQEKIIAPVPVAFKGKGFYETDYKEK